MILHLGAPAKKAILDLLTNPGSQAPLQRCGKRHVFFWVIISLYRRLHWGLVRLEYSFKTCPTWFMLLNLIFPTMYKPMRIHESILLFVGFLLRTFFFKTYQWSVIESCKCHQYLQRFCILKSKQFLLYWYTQLFVWGTTLYICMRTLLLGSLFHYF